MLRWFVCEHCQCGLRIFLCTIRNHQTERGVLPAVIALNPRHAYAHVALGAFQAAVIDKLGPMVGAMTYGVTARAALDHLEEAQRLAPHSPAVLHECAGALLLMDGSARLEEANRLQEAAAHATPRDAVERLWVELSRTSLAL